MSFSWEHNTDNRDDELADAHDDSTPDEEAASSKLFDHVERGRSCSDIDDVGDHRNQKGIFHTDLLEERGSIVDCKVSTLFSLEND